MAKEKADKVFTVRVPESLYDSFRICCDKNYQTMSSAIKDLMNQFLKDNMEKLEVVERIEVSDDCGNPSAVIRLQTIIRSAHLGGVDWIPGLQTLVDEKNRIVQDCGNGDFLVVSTGERLKRVLSQ